MPEPDRSSYDAKLRDRVWLIDSWLPSSVGSLLDAGCARGEAMRVYARRARYTVGIELDPEEVAAGRKADPTLELKQASCEAIPFPDHSFDAVVCADVIEHVGNEVRVLAELRRVLAPGGFLILTTPHRGWFDLLDPVNYPRRIAPMLWRLSPRLYSAIEKRTQDLAPEGRPGPARQVQHRHYRVQDLEALLERAGWDLDKAVERVFRGGGLLYVLWSNVVYFSSLGLRRYPRLHRLVLESGGQLADLDYRISWGRASFNLAVLVRRH
ncbi:MAG: class I SAM-dependent methyltransferase [Solirubrobacteraceae bacterium]